MNTVFEQMVSSDGFPHLKKDKPAWYQYKC